MGEKWIMERDEVERDEVERNEVERNEVGELLVTISSVSAKLGWFLFS